MTATAAASDHTSHRSGLWRALSQPQGWLVLLVAGQLLFWTVVPWLFAWSLPLDVVSDGIAWGHEWQWGYYKHPPLPSWLAELFFVALGNIGPFLLSQIAIAATYGLVFLLGREFMPARWAAAGALLLAGVYYFSVPTPEFNHNVAQMPLWAAASLFYYRAWKGGGLRWWLALGIAAGFGLIAKYATGVLLVAMLAHFIRTRGLRFMVGNAGPALAIVACVAVVAPHLVWLFRNGFPTLHYAVGRAGTASAPLDRFVAPAKFLLAQGIDIAPAFLAAAIAGLLPRRPASAVRDENMRFLLWLTLGPPLLTACVSLATGLGIRDMWGAPMWNLTGLVIAEAALLCRANPAWTRLAISVATLFVLGLLVWLFSNVFVPEFEGRPSRIQWPDQQMSQSLAAAWQHQMHRPLTIVAADGWIGGLVAMGTSPRASVWIDASYAKSPWITPRRLAQEGALVVWRIRSENRPPPPLAHVRGLQIVGVKSFAWPATPKAPPLRIGYGVIPPRGNNS
ncbi:MAG TPA: glycosyltransferase family 39 protein [Rhizomicrobium sp.]|jgi:4-amino-4-deoxy-L-arabinose transferase-like glycosyltransferase